MTESSTYRSRRFQAGSSAFQIVTDGPETLQSFDALFAQFDEALPGDELVVITINTAGDQRYTASHRDSTICRSVGRHDLALWVTRFVNRHVLDHEPDLLHVHAGAVSNGDATALIVGQSFAGKSTLVAALVQPN